MGSIQLQSLGERLIFAIAGVLVVLLLVVMFTSGGSKGKGAASAVSDLSLTQPVVSPERRLHAKGEIWEPSIAADSKGNVVAMGLRIRDLPTGKKKVTNAVASPVADSGGESEAALVNHRTVFSTGCARGLG